MATTLSKAENYIVTLAWIYAHFGDADLAFEKMQKLIDMRDYELSAASLRHDPIWDPIRKDPRFEKNDNLTRCERGEVACSERVRRVEGKTCLTPGNS